MQLWQVLLGTVQQQRAVAAPGFLSIETCLPSVGYLAISVYDVAWVKAEQQRCTGVQELCGLDDMHACKAYKRDYQFGLRAWQ